MQLRADAKAGGSKSELTDVTSKVVIYEVFVEARLESPKLLPLTRFALRRSTATHEKYPRFHEDALPVA